MEDKSGSILPTTEQLIATVVEYGVDFLKAVVVLVIGLWLIARFVRMLRLFFTRRELEKTLQSFLLSFISIIFKVLLIISVISMVGIQMTSFIALLGAAGLAFGMALSGTLQNFAGGVMLLINKPFKAGDFIEAQGYTGTVLEIQIFHTVLNTPDKKRVIIPNGSLSGGSLINYTAEPVRRLEWTFGISYTDSIDDARNIILEVLTSDARVQEEPAPFVAVSSLGDSSVNLVTRVWVNLEDFWPLFFDINEKVKKEFDNRGITIPFPQRDVNMRQV